MTFAHTVAVEMSSEHLGPLRAIYDEVIIADLNQLPTLPGDCSAILLGDVLEHVVDQAYLLDRCIRALRPDGLIFISIPNVANIVNRFWLLFGRFEYADRGLLDRTHLRFYTRSSFLRLLADANLEVVAIETSSMPIRLVLSKFLPSPLITALERILDAVTWLMPTLFGYQFVAATRRRRPKE